MVRRESKVVGKMRGRKEIRVRNAFGLQKKLRIGKLKYQKLGLEINFWL